MHEGKSVSDYIAALNKLVDDCNIGGVHERVMRDQIVCGINDTGMQTRLLESVENLETTKNFVVAIETARKDSHMLGAPSVFADMVQSANFVEQPTRKMTEVMCARCSSKHQTTRCRNTACFKCGQKGHLARVCKTAANNGRNCTGSCSVHNMNDLPETELGQGPAWVLVTIEADKGCAAVLRLPDGRQWTWHHDYVQAVPWQPELSEYSGSSHTDTLDASSVQPAVPLDAAGAATSHAPTENTGATATMGFRLGNFRTHVSLVIRVVVPVSRWMPRSQRPFLRLHFPAARECGNLLYVLCPSSRAELSACQL
ncbi:hypothetical protein MRX96_039648 [Rhipicephalus microplus]